jgi:hypothetical protein
MTVNLPQKYYANCVPGKEPRADLRKMLLYQYIALNYGLVGA